MLITLLLVQDEAQSCVLVLASASRYTNHRVPVRTYKRRARLLAGLSYSTRYLVEQQFPLICEFELHSLVL